MEIILWMRMHSQRSKLIIATQLVITEVQHAELQSEQPDIERSPGIIVFHNVSGYDSNLIMQKMHNLTVSVVACSMEKVKCVTIFFDS